MNESAQPQMMAIVQALIIMIPGVLASDCQCDACVSIRGVMAGIGTILDTK